MTQEQKAKAYDEAIERARTLNSGKDVDVKAGTTICEYIFPELKESDDEKIRKSLIHLVHLYGGEFGMIDANTSVEKAIAWLEKQGDKDKLIKELGKYKVKYTQEVLSQQLEKQSHQEEPQVYETENGEVTTYSESEGYKVIEPKFKAGEWITNSFETVQITGYDIDYGYQVDYKGNLQHRDTDIIEKEYHLWTIQDAKPGDVLVDVYGDIGIFEKRYGYNWHTYCYLGNEGRLFPEGGSHGSICYPATKEQRDLLFQKMKEAGYEWDSEKKELKKIHVIDEGKAEMMNGEKVSSAWSKDDEKRIGKVMHTLSLDGRISNTELKTILDWLKSLKDRYTWKPSDEQMHYLSWIANVKLGDSVVEQEVSKHLNELYKDLKKLREE